MAKMNPIYRFDPNAPKALITTYIKAGRNTRKLSKELNVNHFYINQLLKYGIEPTNPEIRVKLFLPRTHRKPPTPRPEEWVGQKRVKRNVAKMAKKTREPELYEQEIIL